MSEVEAAIATLADFAPCLCSGGFRCSRCLSVDVLKALTEERACICGLSQQDPECSLHGRPEQAVPDIHAIEKERDQWRRNYYDVADALAAKSESPAHLTSIARDLRQQITRIERERDEARAELRDERQRFDSLDELACKAIRERDEARNRSDTFQGECARLMRERDEVTKWGQETVARTVNERDAARQQVAQRDNRVQELALQLIGIEKERDAAQEQAAYWQRAAHEFEQESIRELAQRDRRIAEIEAAADGLELLRSEAVSEMQRHQGLAEVAAGFYDDLDVDRLDPEYFGSGSDGRRYRRLRDAVRAWRAALSPAPAQPATATKPMIVGREVISEPGASIRIERLELTEEAQRGLSVGKVAAENFQRAHVAPPSPAAHWTCSCGYMNAGIVCTKCGKPSPAAREAEERDNDEAEARLQAPFRSEKRTAAPAAREATTCRCGHDKDQHSTQGDGCLVNAFDGDDPPCKCMRFSPPPRDVNSSNRDPFDYDQLRNLIHQERWRVKNLDVADIVEVVRKWIDGAISKDGR